MKPRRFKQTRQNTVAASIAGLIFAAFGACSVFEPDETPSDESDSVDLREHYSKQQEYLLRAGLLRTDPPSRHEDFDAAALAANFEQIALRREYKLNEGKFEKSSEPSVIGRWSRPIRVAVVLGEGLTDYEREAAHANVSDFVERLRRITGHDMKMSEIRPNVHVFIIDGSEAAEMRKRWPEAVHGIPKSITDEIGLDSLETFCSAYTMQQFNGPNMLSRAIVLIKAEHPDLVRLSCIHEELAQVLGLFNDSPNARPSIFNDDEEFALLTYHDELLLRILYDPRLRPGMDAATAMPIVREIARELRPDQ